MKSKLNIIIQILATLLQVAGYVSGMVPIEYAPLFSGVITVIQGIVAILAHYANPDGTPATTAYKP